MLVTRLQGYSTDCRLSGPPCAVLPKFDPGGLAAACPAGLGLTTRAPAGGKADWFTASAVALGRSTWFDCRLFCGPDLRALGLRWTARRKGCAVRCSQPMAPAGVLNRRARVTGRALPLSVPGCRMSPILDRRAQVGGKTDFVTIGRRFLAQPARLAVVRFGGWALPPCTLLDGHVSAPLCPAVGGD